MNHCANCNGSPRVEPDHNEIRRNADAAVREMSDTARGVLMQCATEEGLDAELAELKAEVETLRVWR